MKRRKFFKTAGLTLAGAVIAPQLLVEDELIALPSRLCEADNICIESILYISTNGTWKSVGCIKELKMDEVNKAAEKMVEHAEKLLLGK